MKKTITIISLALACSNACMAETRIKGKWNCQMVSDYGEFMFELSLNGDNTFKNREEMFGKMNVGTGKWSVEGNILTMNREKYIKDGVEKVSTQEFRREIVSNSKTTLEMKHDKATTTCTKS